MSDDDKRPDSDLAKLNKLHQRLLLVAVDEDTIRPNGETNYNVCDELVAMGYLEELRDEEGCYQPTLEGRSLAARVPR